VNLFSSRSPEILALRQLINANAALSQRVKVLRVDVAEKHVAVHSSNTTLDRAIIRTQREFPRNWCAARWTDHFSPVRLVTGIKLVSRQMLDKF
jgi:hypothetical protein